RAVRGADLATPRRTGDGALHARRRADHSLLRWRAGGAPTGSPTAALADPHLVGAAANLRRGDAVPLRVFGAPAAGPTLTGPDDRRLAGGHLHRRASVGCRAGRARASIHGDADDPPGLAATAADLGRRTGRGPIA